MPRREAGKRTLRPQVDGRHAKHLSQCWALRERHVVGWGATTARADVWRDRYATGIEGIEVGVGLGQLLHRAFSRVPVLGR
jgi:hypothetical protein